MFNENDDILISIKFIKILITDSFRNEMNNK